ncbi:LOG family protein [Cohaesibacter celericrescens]|uniref:LOG family protein n=1 Tax=Cohaesibacter celericrescens TaxID=2067669 RepID=UPI0035694A8E
MAILKKICVYCGSGRGNDPAYSEAARLLGRDMANQGIDLVYGGGSVGLMGITAKSVLDNGGKVTGIIPGFLQEREVMLDAVQELIVTEDMHERKRKMFESAQAFIALPGGIGTLEELVEMLTWAQLGRHKKPVLLANINGFWDPLMRLLDHMREEEFIRSGMEVSFLSTSKPEEMVSLLIDAAKALPDTAFIDESEGHDLKRF